MKKLILLFFLVLIASAFTPIQEKSLATTPVPTAMPCKLKSPVHDEWKTLVCESFDVPSSKWWTGMDLTLGIEGKIEDGKYKLEYNPKNSTGYKKGFAISVNFAQARDYAVSITGKINSKYKSTLWGMIVRGTNKDGYSFTISNFGTYYLTYQGSSKVYIGNLKKGANNKIIWDEENTITIVVEGKNMTFYVNGEPLFTYEADNSSKMDISWQIWGGEGVQVSYELDDFLVKTKP